ncbi:MAG: hypothetical protein IT314_14160 [Anaerolineales bacterium]|nr:hypothetical protein [Anaerolineales bacterium]
MSLVSLNQIEEAREAVCPSNGKMGRRVDSLTVKALLGVSIEVLRDVEYRFCIDPNCVTVYYSADGLQEFTENDLRERVYQKHPDDEDVLLCYCFQHAVKAVRTNGARVYAEIDRGVRNEKCACDIRNPQGSCCLGNVNKLVKRSSF